MATTVNGRGQVTLPRAIRDRLGIAAGDSVVFELTPGGRVILAKHDAEPHASPFESLRGCAGPGLSTEQVLALTRGED